MTWCHCDALCIFVALTSRFTQVYISNVRPRFNTSGQIMDAHDGTYNQWTPGGPWYYYAMVK